MENILENATAILQIIPEQWARMTQTVPSDSLKRPAAPGEWSALECLHHLVATEAIFYYRVNAFLTDAPEFPAYNPDAPDQQIDPGVSPGKLVDEFVRRRTASLTALQNLTTGDLQRVSRHAELGRVTLEEMLHEWAAHDLNHTVQAERALMQPLIQGAGPWKVYFSDQVIEA